MAAIRTSARMLNRQVFQLSSERYIEGIHSDKVSDNEE